MSLENKLKKYKVSFQLKNSDNQSDITEEIENVEEEKLESNQQTNDQDFLFNFFSKVQVHTLLEIVGEEDRYQKILLVILCLYNFFYAFIGFFIGYLYYEPNFICFDQNQQKFSCTEMIACNNPYGFVIESPIKSLVTEYQLYCDRSSLKQETQGFFIVVAGFLAFIFGVMSDTIGRRKVFIFAWYFSIAGLVIALISNNLYMITLGNTLAWAGMDMFFSMVFIYSNEIIGGKLRQKSNAILFFFWASGEIMINIINIFISNFKVNYIIQIIPLTALGITFWYIQESPYVLFKMKKIKQLIKVLLFIAKQNLKNVEETQKKLEQEFNLDALQISNFDQIKKLNIVSANKVKKNFMKKYWQGAKSVFHHKVIFWKLLGAAVLAGNIYVGYGLCILIPQRMGLSNIYVNGIFLGISELLGNFIIIPFGDKLKRRILNFVCSLVITLCCVVLLIFELVKDNISPGSLQWYQTILSSIIKLALCANFALIFTYCSELFPTKIRGLCLGLCVLIGRGSSVFSLSLERITDRIGVHPMISVIFGSALTMPIALLMPETFGKGVSNQLIFLIFLKLILKVNKIYFL